MSTDMKKGSGVASFLASVESKKQQFNDVPQQSNPNIETWNDGTTAGARVIKDTQSNPLQELFNKAIGSNAQTSNTPNGFQRMFDNDTRSQNGDGNNVGYLLESALQGAKNSGYGIANTFNEMNKYYDPTLNTDNLNAMADFVANTEQRVDGVKNVREKLYNAQDSSNQAFNEKYADKEGALKVAGDVAQGVGGMIPNIAANMIIPGAGMATMFASATGNKYKEAIQDGATDNQALLSGVLSGGVEVATEKLFDGISTLGKGLGLEKKITNWLGSRIGGPATKQVMEKVIGMLGEGAEEAISEYANAFITKIYNDNGKDFLETMIDTTPDALYSALMGAITSSVIEGSTNVVSNGAKSFLTKVENAKIAENPQNFNSNPQNQSVTEQLQQNDVVSGTEQNEAQIEQIKSTNNVNEVIDENIPSDINHKQKQLDIILENNPAEDDLHTWIRNVDDIKTFEETLQDPDWQYGDFDPDYTTEMANEAIKSGEIMVYSSYPIDKGVFVTPSKMEAESYSGNGKVYSKKLKLTDVAWIDPTQGQYAPVNDTIALEVKKDTSIVEPVPQYKLSKADTDLVNDLANEFGIENMADLEANILPLVKEMDRTGKLSAETKDALYRYVSKNTTGDELFNSMGKGKSDVRHYNFDSAMNKYIDSKLNKTTTEKSTKVLNYEKSAKNHLVKYLSNEFSVSPYQVKNLVGEFIDRAAQQIQTKGKVDNYLVNDIFNKMADNSYTIDDEMRKTYQPLIDDLKATTFQLDQDTRNGMSDTDLKLFKKDNQGRFKIGNNGVSVDAKYKELSSQYPEFFPTDLSSGDMLNQIAEVLDSLDDKYTRNSEIMNNDPLMREAAQFEFNKEYNNFLNSMRNAQNVANEMASKKELKDKFDYNFYKEQQEKISKLQREYEKVRNKTILDTKGNHYLNGLMNGAITIDDVDAEYKNDVLAMYKVKKPYEDAKEVVKTYQKIYKEGLRDEMRGLIANIEGWQIHKKFNGLLWEIDTAERNLRDVAGEDAEPLIEKVFSPIKENEALATKFKNERRKIIKELNLSKAEAEAVQMLGERADIGGRPYCEADVVEAGLNLEKITNAVGVFRKQYNDFYDQVNEVRVRNGYKPFDFRKDYFPHFIDPEPNTKLAKALKKLGLNLAEDNLDADIAGITENFRPGTTWFGHGLQRKTNLTKYDAVEGFDRYIEGVSNIIFHTDDIQRLRALDTEIRYQASDDGFKSRIDEIYEADLFEEERQDKLQAEYEKQAIISKYGNLTTWLTNYTNNLANKKSAADRQMEYDLGRGVYTISKQLEGRVAANMVAANASSAMSNFIPITQALGECKTSDIVKAMHQTLSNNMKNDSFIDDSVFLTNRRGSERLTKTTLQEISDKFSIPFQMVDDFVSSTVVRAKYLGNIDKGMTHEQAMADADSYGASLMADRSKGAMPLVFERKNPVAKLFTMFQLEQNNQINYLLKDLPRGKKEEAATALLMAIMRMSIGAWCFNEINELIFGRRSALDPIDMAYSTFKTATDENLNIIEKGVEIGKEVGQELPFIGGYLGGGRLPISSALPDFDSVARIADDGYTTSDRVEIASQSLIKPLSYLVAPFGAGQAWKSYEGLKAYNEGGVYNTTSDGKRLKYTVDDNIANLLRGAIAGKSSFPEASEYYDSGRSPLTVNQTKAFEAAKDLGADAEDLIEAIYKAKEIQSVKKNGKTIANSKAALIRDMLDEYDLTTPQKKALYESVGVGKTIAEMGEAEFRKFLRENGLNY